MPQAKFNIHNVWLAIDCPFSEISDRIENFLCPFLAEPFAGQKHRFIQFIFRKNQTKSLSQKAQEIKQKGCPLIYYEDLRMTRFEDVSLYEDPYSQVLIHRKKNTVEGYFDIKTLKNGLFFENIFFGFLLWEVLSLHQLFLIHSACISSPEGCGLLFPGLSRQGKTTLSLALVRSGYSFLSDDLCFYSPQGEIYPFPRSFHVDPVLSQSFPELSFLYQKPPYFPFNPKRNLSLEKLGALYPHTHGKPLSKMRKINYVLFPTIRPVGKSRLASLGNGEALAKMIPPSALLMVGEETAMEQLHGLKMIIEGAHCMEFILGKDLRDQPETIVHRIQNLTNSRENLKGEFHATAGL
jgi:hypothetical protein